MKIYEQITFSYITFENTCAVRIKSKTHRHVSIRPYVRLGDGIYKLKKHGSLKKVAVKGKIANKYITRVYL